MNEARRIALALIVACMDDDREAIHALTDEAEPVLLADVATNLACLVADVANRPGETDPEFSYDAVRARIVAELRASP